METFRYRQPGKTIVKTETEMVFDTADLFRDLPITTFYHAAGGVSLDRDRRSVVYVTDNGDNI